MPNSFSHCRRGSGAAVGAEGARVYLQRLFYRTRTTNGVRCGLRRTWPRTGFREPDHPLADVAAAEQTALEENGMEATEMCGDAAAAPQ